MATASGASYVLSSTHNVFVGSAPNTAISVTGSGTLTYNGVIANKPGSVGSWAKQGSGILALGGVNTYGGDTTINSGSLQITTDNDRLPTGTTVNLGQTGSASLGTLDLNGFNQAIAGLNSIIGTNATVGVFNTVKTGIGSSVLTLGGSGSYAYGDNTTANSGILTGALSIVKSGTGFQKFGGANTYTGTTTVNGGILQFAKLVSLYNNTPASWTASNIVVNNGGTLAFNVGGTGEFTATEIAALSALGTGSGGFKNGAILGLDTSNASGGNFNYGGVLANTNGGSNALGLSKLGTGTLTLSGANTYTGPTAVRGGTLALASTGSINSSATITVDYGASYNVSAVNNYTLGSATSQTLRGEGTVTGSVIVAPGSKIRGGSPGVIGVLQTGDVNLGGGSPGAVLQVEAKRLDVNQVQASTIDLQASSGVLNFNPGAGKFTIEVVNNAGYPLLPGETYTFALAVANAGNIRLNGAPLSANATIGASSYSLQSSDFAFSNVSLGIDGSGTNVLLTFTPVPVPEPGTVLGVAAAALGVGGFVRRRFRKGSEPTNAA